jgi:hypothetical protein
MAMAVAGLTRRSLFLGYHDGGSERGFGAQALGFSFGQALTLGGFLGAAAVSFSELLLFGQVALLGFLELAQDLAALVVLRRAGIGDLGRLDQRHLLAHDHVDRLAVLAAADGEFLLAAAIERDLARRGRGLGRLVGLAVGAAQEAEKFHLLGAGDDLVGIAERHARFGQLLDQLLDRCIHQFGQLADGGLLRHSDSGSLRAARGPCCGWSNSTAAMFSIRIDGAIHGGASPAPDRQARPSMPGRSRTQPMPEGIG